jgi:hypothetical protein
MMQPNSWRNKMVLQHSMKINFFFFFFFDKVKPNVIRLVTDISHTKNLRYIYIYLKNINIDLKLSLIAVILFC